MTESYGYYTYGDIKLKTLQGKTSWGFEKTPRTINVVSKNANSYKTEIAKNYDTSNSVLSVSKNALCNGISLVKSANSHFNLTEINVNNKGYMYDIRDTKDILVQTTNMGFYEITTSGQIAKYNLNIIPTPSNATVIINGLEQTLYNGYETEEITYEVSCDGYLSRIRTFNLMNDETINVDLEAPTTLLKIITEPEDVIVMIDGKETHEAYVVPGKTITYQVYKDGYCFEDGNDVLTVEITPQDIEIEEYSYTMYQKFIQTNSYANDGITISGSGSSSFYASSNVTNAYVNGYRNKDTVTTNNWTPFPYSNSTASYLYLNIANPKFIKSFIISACYYNTSTNNMRIRFYDENGTQISSTTYSIPNISSTRNPLTISVNKVVSKIQIYAQATKGDGYQKIISKIKIT